MNPRTEQVAHLTPAATPTEWQLERDFSEQVTELLVNHGVRVSRQLSRPLDFKFVRGVKMVANEETGDSYSEPNEVGEIVSQWHQVKSPAHWDDDGTQHSGEVNTYGETIYKFNEDLAELFPQIMAAIPSSLVTRVIQRERSLNIHFYPDLTNQETTQLQRQSLPYDHHVVYFGQGEWALVDGLDQNHTIASFGKSDDACRYILLHDPVTQRAAASHLDLLADESAIAEMRGHLLRLGSRGQDIKLRMSSNVSEATKLSILAAYPGTIFDLDFDFMFDVQTGALHPLDPATEANIMADEEAHKRITDNVEIRLRHNIAQVKVYQSLAHL